MTNMASVSRPPSMHAPWRKSFIIPLFFFHLGFAALVCSWGLSIYGVAIYLGTDTGISAYGKKVYVALGILGIFSVFIVIAHIVFFARFWLTSRMFVLGNAVVLVLSVIQLVLGVMGDMKGHIYNEDGTYWDMWMYAFMCFFSIWMLVYSVLVWRRVNWGRTAEMARPRRELAGGSKGIDAQGGDAIPMV